MSWLSRLFTLPRSRNSFRDIIGTELWQRLEQDIEATGAFYRACTDYMNRNPENVPVFARELVAVLADNARLLQLGLSTEDPFFSVRNNTRAFARRWGLNWNGRAIKPSELANRKAKGGVMGSP